MAKFTNETAWKIYEKLGGQNLGAAITDEEDGIAMYESWYRKTGIKAFRDAARDEKRHLANLLEIKRKIQEKSG